MRFLLSIAVLTLWAVIRSNAAPNRTSIETIDNRRTTRSLGLMLGLDADDAQALDLVIDLLSNFRSNYLKTVSSDIINSSFSFFSPINEFIVLSMLFYGVKDDRKTILTNRLGFANHYPPTVGRGFYQLIRYFNMIDDGVGIDTRTELSDSALLLPGILHAFRQYFHSSVETRDRIETCNGLTLRREYFNPPASQSAGPRVRVTNAIRVQKTWAFPVQSARTESPFDKKGANGVVRRETLRISGKFRYGKLSNVNATFVELPLESQDPENGMSVIVYRPDNHDDYPELISQLGTIDLEKHMREDPKEVEFSMPKFEMQVSAKPYRRILRLFEPETLFSDGSRASERSLDRFSHSGYIYVNELGISVGVETSTHTSARKIRSPGSSRDEEIVLDRPFVATVTTTGTRMIQLFTIISIDSVEDNRPIDESSTGEHDSEFVKSFQKLSG